MLWGDASTGTSTSIRYLAPFYSDTAVTSTDVLWEVTSAFRATSIRVRCTVAGTGTGTVVFTLLRNGLPTSVTVTLSITGVSVSAGPFSELFAVGDTVSMQQQGFGVLSSGSGRFTVAVGVEPP